MNAQQLGKIQIGFGILFLMAGIVLGLYSFGEWNKIISSEPINFGSISDPEHQAIVVYVWNESLASSLHTSYIAMTQSLILVAISIVLISQGLANLSKRKA